MFFLSLLLLVRSPLEALYFEGSLNNKSIFLVDLRAQNNFTYWDFFNEVIFNLPHALQAAKIKNISTYIMVPHDLDGFSPIDPKAPFIESIRTFLTCASIYYLFNNENQWPLFIIYISEKHYNLSVESIILNLQNYQDRTFSTIDECIIHFDGDNLIETRSNFLELESKKCVKNNSMKKILNVPGDFSIKSSQKRFCISGGAGFIGATLVKKLLNQGHQVIVLDNLLCSTLENLQKIQNKNLFFINQDVTQPFTIDVPIDIVIHLASVPSPEDYYKMPEETLRVGLEGTKHMIELAREKNARFLFSSTSEVYGDPDISIQSEEYPGNVNYLGPRAQYDQSKRAAETMLKLYFDTYHMDIRIARIFNTYGPGMRLHDGRVITNFIAAILENKPLKIYGNGQQTRSFGYIDDTVQGLYNLAIQDLERSNTITDFIFNIGTPLQFTINELATKIEGLAHKYLKQFPTIIHIPNPDHTDPHQRYPDITKARKTLAFDPIVSLDEGLEKTFLYFFTKVRQ